MGAPVRAVKKRKLKLFFWQAEDPHPAEESQITATSQQEDQLQLEQGLVLFKACEMQLETPSGPTGATAEWDLPADPGGPWTLKSSSISPREPFPGSERILH